MENEIILPNDLFFEEVKMQLDAGKKVYIHVKGGSMRPFLRNGDKVLIAPVDESKVEVGTIVLASTAIGIVLHRICRIENDLIILNGDGNAKQFEQTSFDRLIGFVEEGFHKDKKRNINSRRMRFWAKRWKDIRPLRGIFLRIYDLIEK